LRRRSLWIWLGLIPILMLVSSPRTFAQEESPKQFIYYTLGQQSFALSAGIFVPLFLQEFGGDTSSTNLSLGAVGSLQWGTHLDNHWMLGAEIGGMFCSSTLKNSVLMLPITAKGTYIFHAFPFEFPVFLGAGINVLKYESQSHLDFILKPGFSSMWKYSSSWAFGVNFAYWWIPQGATGDQDKEMARIGNFLEITATAKYSF